MDLVETDFVSSVKQVRNRIHWRILTASLKNKKYNGHLQILNIEKTVFMNQAKWNSLCM